jgi:hypothetical protein
MRSALDVAAPHVLRTTSGATAYWCAPRALGNVASSAHLLPPFDEYALGYRDRRPQIAAADTKRVNAGGGMPKATVVVDGRVIGTWSRLGGKGQTTVRVQPFSPVSEAAQAALGAAADRLGSFLKLPLSLSIASSTGPEGGSS